MAEIYSDSLTAKNGEKIPVFKNLKPMHSKYNPEKEAESFSMNVNAADFFIVIGIGAGFHIKNLQKTFPESKILCIEYYEQDLNFVKNEFSQTLSCLNSEKIIYTDYSNLSSVLQENYLPCLFEKLSIIPHKVWQTENKELCENIIQKINETLKLISADYSVQCHFGKIWQKNILKNLKMNSRNISFKAPENKTAAVIAAGPSLDETCSLLINNRNKYFIISTDTAYKALLNRKISSDAVVSIDGQYVSQNHFSENINPETIFIFDYCGNSSAVEKISKNGNKIIFTNSSHPLVNFAEMVTDNRESSLVLTNGSGTVTSTAIDFAVKSGFKNIEVFGADFSFTGNKAYTRGSYLDELFLNCQNKKSSLEKQFIRLMYRTELIENSNNIKTTPLLERYRTTLYQWLECSGLEFKTENNIIFIKNNGKNNPIILKPFDFESFRNKIREYTEALESDFTRNMTNPLFWGLLPFISAKKQENAKNNQNLQNENLLKLAISHLVRYTESL